MIELAEKNMIERLEQMLAQTSESPEIDLITDPLMRLGKKIQTLVDESKAMHLRLLNIERRLATGRDDEGRSRSLAKAVLNPSEAEDFAHEAHLKLVTILAEINDVKASFSLLKNTATDPLLKPEGIPNFSNYVPYMTRLMDLETRLAMLPQKDSIDRLVHDMDSLKAVLLSEMASSRSTLPSGLADVLQELGSLRKQVSEGRSESRKGTVSIQPGRDPLDIAPQAPEAESFREIQFVTPIDPNSETLKQAVVSLQKAVTQKVNRTEIESIMSSMKRSATFNIEQGRTADSASSFEERMATYSKELERLHKDFAENLRVLSEVDDHVNRQERLQQESLQRLKSEFSQRLEDFSDKLNTAADDPESAKTLAALKVVILKLQKEVKELKTEALNRPLSTPKLMSSGDATPIMVSDDGVNELVQKHESLLNQLSIQIAKIYADFEETQVQIQRQNEAMLGGSLKQMEELRRYVGTIMEKVSEGAKLSQNDLEKLNEVMAILEEKGDKTEVRTKVDKMELKKTHRILSRRIEALQRELKKSESAAQLPPPREDPLMIKTRFDHECLACGQEVPFPTWQREWKASRKFPETRFRIGPGFSKILPVLKELSDVYLTHHQKTLSEGRSTPAERGFTPMPTPMTANSDRGTLMRIMTSNPGSRSSHIRRKDQL